MIRPLASEPGVEAAQVLLHVPQASVLWSSHASGPSVAPSPQNGPDADAFAHVAVHTVQLFGPAAWYGHVVAPLAAPLSHCSNAACLVPSPQNAPVPASVPEQS